MVGENISRPSKILITDDERDLVEMLAFSLGRRGYEIARAYDGQDAWERVKEERFDLLILDLMMPGLDGWEVCRLIRQSDKLAIQEIPILILTARAMAEDRVRGLEMGANEYLTKPFSLPELTLRVEKLLSQRRVFESLRSDLRNLQNQTLGQEERMRKIIHDLKTPLLSMGASAKLPMKPREKEDALEMLRCIYENSLRMSRRLEEILLFSSPNLSEMRVPKQQIDLRLLLKRMREFFITLALEKKIELKFHPLPPFPPLLGYEGWMERALENLLGNALKYTQEGGVVEVGGAIAPEEGKMEIWVQDNGRGILPEDIQQIFHPFQRGGNALNEPGAGLGLSLVKEVVDLHGGEVQVRSEPGKGSVFSLFFPLKTDHLPEKAGKMAC